jgi:hypothetical protein
MGVLMKPRGSGATLADGWNFTKPGGQTLRAAYGRVAGITGGGVGMGTVP